MVTVQANRTRFCLLGSKACNVPWRDVHLPLQVAVEQAILTEAAGGAQYDLQVCCSTSAPLPGPLALGAPSFGQIGGHPTPPLTSSSVR